MKELSRDLYVMNFVQFVSAPQSHAKRVRKIKKTMETCPADLTETQWMKMWRGFYYAIWYSEMRKGGEELIEEIGAFKNESYLLSGFKSLTESWGGIDSFRIDKYMFLVRHMLRNVIKQQIAALLEDKPLFENNPFLDDVKKSVVANGAKTSKENKSTQSQVADVSDALNETSKPITITTNDGKANVIDYIVSVTSNSVGLFLHICDIYLDELHKAVNELLTSDHNDVAKANTYYHMLIPFAKRLSTLQDDRLRKAIRDDIFEKLLNEVIIEEAIAMRLDMLSKFLDPLVAIASRTPSGKNRNFLYSILEKLRSKVAQLKCPTKDRVKLKRKVIGVDRKAKKLKYEIGSSVPFVRSLVPLPLI